MELQLFLTAKTMYITSITYARYKLLTFSDLRYVFSCEFRRISPYFAVFRRIWRITKKYSEIRGNLAKQ